MVAPDVDVAILGGGPAGAAAACELRRRGRSVAIVDPGRQPAARVETLAAGGTAIAAALGLAPAFAAAFLGRAAEMRMEWREVGERIAYRGAGPTLLDRGRLHAALRSEAADRGARILVARGGAPRSLEDRVAIVAGNATIAARLVLDARGRAAPGLPAAAGPAPDLVAVPFHGRADPAEATREPILLLEALRDAWIWACRAPGGLTVGALFLPAAMVAGAGAAARHAMVRTRVDATVGLRSLCGIATLRPQAAALRAVADPLAGVRTIRIGDAALAHDPIASHGLVHALRSAAQAAAAADTLLDPAGDATAAHAFLRERHAAAAAHARAATARAYADRAERAAEFAAGTAPAASERAPAPRLPGGALALGAPLRRAAVLVGDRIRWAAALEMPGGRKAAFLGPFTAPDLAALLDPPAPFAALAERLERAADAGAARTVLSSLLSEGALTGASRRVADLNR